DHRALVVLTWRRLVTGSDGSAVVRALHSTTRDRHEDLANLVRGLPEGGLTWTPAPDAPAIAGLTLHVLDVERHVASLIEGIDDGWTGERGTRILEAADEAQL